MHNAFRLIHRDDLKKALCNDWPMAMTMAEKYLVRTMAADQRFRVEEASGERLERAFREFGGEAVVGLELVVVMARKVTWSRRGIIYISGNACRFFFLDIGLG